MLQFILIPTTQKVHFNGIFYGFRYGFELEKKKTFHLIPL